MRKIKTMLFIMCFFTLTQAEADWQERAIARIDFFVKNKKISKEILTHAQEAARETNIPITLVLAVIEVESSFDIRAKSRAGAVGLMQVIPEIWRDKGEFKRVNPVKSWSLGRPSDNLFDIETNIKYGCVALYYFLSIEGFDLDQGLARYNGSKGYNYYPRKIEKAWRKNWVDL